MFVNLQSAFDNVERSDQEVSDAASQETSQAAERVELVAAEFAGIPVVNTICYTVKTVYHCDHG